MTPKALELNTFQTKDPSSEGAPSFDPLRNYQKKMLKALEADAAKDLAPWLGLASPMQTGKSHLITPIVQMLRKKFGFDSQFFILSSARIITDQILKDMGSQFQEKIGRFDGLHKDIQPITVASARAMANHLDLFSTDLPTILINDEAYSTQAETFRQIYSHFGLGEIQGVDGRSVLLPKRGNGFVVGLSGTGGGLEGYHVSHQLNLLEAIELGAIRQMWGERVVLKISSQEKRIAGEEFLVWWEPTLANAKALVELYEKKIHDFFPKSMVFVPTIEHGDLFFKALRMHFGKNVGYHVHSQMSDGDFFTSLEKWARKGGPLISVKRLGRGFRGTGTMAVFHTYQTTSPELYAQRTGRAWAKTDAQMPDLYVLEVAWNPRGSFANLARLLGLIDYPGPTVHSRRLKPLLENQRKKRVEEERLHSEVRRGKVSPVFVGIPLEEQWRSSFMELVEKEGGLSQVSQKTGLSTEILAGFALGALPVRLQQVERLQEFLGGNREAKKTWVQAWERAVADLLGGRSQLHDGLTEELIRWKHQAGEKKSAAKISASALELDRILEKNLKFLGSTMLRRQAARLQVQSGDIDLLKEAYAEFWTSLNPEFLDPKLPSPVKDWSHQELARRLSQSALNDAEWRQTWVALVEKFKESSENSALSPEKREAARRRLETLTRYFFERQGWDPLPHTARQKLLYGVRRAVAFKFGSTLPIQSGIEGIGNHEFTTMQKWIQGEEISNRGSAVRLYGKIKHLLQGLGYSPPAIRALTVPAVFEEQAWPWKAQTANEKLLRETRYWVAASFGGTVPLNWDFLEKQPGHYRPPPTAPWEPAEGQDEMDRPYKEPGYRDDGSLNSLAAWVQNGKGNEDYDPNEYYPLLTRFLVDISPPRRILPFIYARFIEDMKGASTKEARSAFLGTLLWLQAKYHKYLPILRYEIPFGPALDSKANDPFETIAGKNLQKMTYQALITLTPREEKVLRMLYGIGERKGDYTLEEVASDFEVTRERIRQIERKGLRKLRHPLRRKLLKEFVLGGQEPASVSGVFPQLHASLLQASEQALDPALDPLTWARVHALPEAIINHLQQTRYIFPEKYPFLLLKLTWKCLLEGVNVEEYKTWDKFLRRLQADLNPEEKKLLRFEFIRDDIRFFLKGYHFESLAEPKAASKEEITAIPSSIGIPSAHEITEPFLAEKPSRSHQEKPSKPPVPPQPLSPLEKEIAALTEEIPFLNSTAFLLRGLILHGSHWEKVKKAGERILLKVLQNHKAREELTLKVRALHDAILSYRVREKATPGQVMERLSALESVLGFKSSEQDASGFDIQDRARAQAIVEDHFKQTRYIFPKEYPFLLFKIFRACLIEGVDVRKQKSRDEFLDRLQSDILNGEEKKLLRSQQIREDIHFFLTRHHSEFLSKPKEMEPPIPPQPLSPLEQEVEALKNEIPFLSSTEFLLRGLALRGNHWKRAIEEGERVLLKALRNPKPREHLTLAVRGIHDAILSYRIHENATPKQVMERLRALEWVFDR